LSNANNNSEERSVSTSNAPDELAVTDKKNSPIFRQEAIDQVSVRQYGTILLTHPVNHIVLTLVFFILSVLLISFFIFFETTRKVPIKGMLVPKDGVTRVFPNQIGVIKKILIKENQYVESGEILFVISNERNSADHQSAEGLISALLMQRRSSFSEELQQVQRQTQQREAALKKQTQDLLSEINVLQTQAQIQKQRVALSEQSLSRYTELKKTNYISTAQLQERESELLEQRQRVLEIERIISNTQRDLSSSQASLQDVAAQALREENVLRRNVSLVEQDFAENEARREIAVRASQSGTVTAISASIGQTVGISTSLASILPKGNVLEAEMQVPSHAVGFIKPGMTALLRYQAFPYQKFGQHSAMVREVASTSVRPEELLSSGSATLVGNNSEPVYRVRLELDGQNVLAYGNPVPLRSGMLVDASIMLERRKLYEWILEPLFSISGRI